MCYSIHLWFRLVAQIIGIPAVNLLFLKDHSCIQLVWKWTKFQKLKEMPQSLEMVLQVFKLFILQNSFSFLSIQLCEIQAFCLSYFWFEQLTFCMCPMIVLPIELLLQWPLTFFPPGKSVTTDLLLGYLMKSNIISYSSDISRPGCWTDLQYATTLLYSNKIGMTSPLTWYFFACDLYLRLFRAWKVLWRLLLQYEACHKW